MFIQVAAITTESIALLLELSQAEVGRCRKCRMWLKSP